MYKRRRAVIEIDMANLIDYYCASDIGDVLKSLPDGTDIISFGCGNPTKGLRKSTNSV